MPNHPNRSKNSPIRRPSRSEMINARLKAGINLKQAGDLVYVSAGRWDRWERGEQPMPLAYWELFNIKVGKL